MIGQTIRSYNRTCTSLLSSQLLFSFRNHCIVPLTDSILSVNATSPSPPSPPALYRAWTHKEPLVAHCLLDSRPTRGQCAKVLTTLSVSSSMIRVGLSTLQGRARFCTPAAFHLRYSAQIAFILFCCSKPIASMGGLIGASMYCCLIGASTQTASWCSISNVKCEKCAVSWKLQCKVWTLCIWLGGRMQCVKSMQLAGW